MKLLCCMYQYLLTDLKYFFLCFVYCIDLPATSNSQVHSSLELIPKSRQVQVDFHVFCDFVMSKVIKVTQDLNNNFGFKYRNTLHKNLYYILEYIRS